MENKSILLHFHSPDGSDTAYAEHVSGDYYKLIENPIFFSDINIGMTVKALPDEKGDLVVVKLIRASEYITRRFLLYSGGPASSELQEKIGNRIIEARGHWEVVFGGIVIVDIPRNGTFDLDKLFAEVNYQPSEIKD